MKVKASTFSAFPEFSRLTLEDRDNYEAFIKDYPPIYDISFPGLMSWWNPLGNMAVCELNGNLVIPYWLPGDEQNSGLSIVGTRKIDESICEIFDHLRSQDKLTRLINVPEFVLSYIRYHDMYIFNEQRDRNEYVMPLSHFYPLKNMADHWRKKVEKFMETTHQGNVIVTNLDLHTKKDKAELIVAAKEWRTKNKINDFGSIEGECMETYIDNSEPLQIENICLIVNDELWGFALFEIPRNKNYIIMKHIKATHPETCGFELLAYYFSKWFIERGFKYVNLGPDYDLNHLRMFMLTIGAANFFRKYTIEPRDT